MEEMQPELVHKVVRVDDGRLLSAMLPDHLATTYRDRAGRIRTADSSMAFRDHKNARAAAIAWASSWDIEMEIWEAYAIVIGRVRRFVTGIVVLDPRPYDYHVDVEQLFAVNPNIITRASWNEVVSRVEASGRLTGTKAAMTFLGDRVRLIGRGEGESQVAISGIVPHGTILCRDLRISELVEHIGSDRS